MYLYTKYNLGLSRYRQCRFEGNDAVDVWHGCLTCIHVAIPHSFVLPSEVIGCLAIVHDGWNVIVVIGCHVIVLVCFFLGFCYFLLLLSPCRQLHIQFVYLVFVGIVLFAIDGSIFYTGIGYLAKQLLVFCLQLSYLHLKHSHFAVGFLLHFVKLRQIQITFHYGCPHCAFLAVCIERLATFTTFVLRCSLSQGHTV